MVKRKNKQKHHEYGELHKTFILGLLANQKTYREISASFKLKFGWKPSDGKIANLKNEALGVSERTPENLTPVQSETQVREIKEKAFDTLNIRQFLVGQMIPLLQKIDLSDAEKIKRLQALTGHILKALDGIDVAHRVLPGINAETVNINQFNFNSLSDEQLLNLRPQFKAVFCDQCPAFKQYHESKHKIIDM